MAVEPLNYNPDRTMRDRQKVKLVLARWDYRAEFEQEVSGNCRGLTIIETAVENVYADLPSAYPDDAAGPCVLTLKGPKGELEVVDDEEQGVDFLNDMLLSAEVVSLEIDDE